MLLRDGIEPCAPHRVVDGAPDRLDVEVLAGEGLEFGAERRQPGQAVLESLGDRTRDRAAGGSQAVQHLAATQVADRLRRLDVILGGDPGGPGIAVMLARHRLQHQCGVGHRAGHGRHIGLVAEQVLCLAVGDDAQALLDAHHPVARGGNARGAAAVGGHPQRREAACHRHRRATARAAAGARRIPGVARAPEQRRIGETFRAELGRGRLADQDRPCGAQPRHRNSVLLGHVVAKGHGTEGGCHPLGVDDVLHRERDAVQQTQPAAGHHGLLGVAGLRHGLLAAQRDEAVQLRLQPLSARKNGAGEFDRRDLPALNHAGQLVCGKETEVFVHGDGFGEGSAE